MPNTISVLDSNEAAVTVFTLDAIAARVGDVQDSPTANTLLDRLKTLATILGEVQASPTENTVLDRLKDIATAIANDMTVSGTVDAVQSGTWNIGSVATLPALPVGTNNIGDVDVLTLPALPAGTNNIGDVDVLTLPALPAGTNNIGDVDVLTLPALVAGSAIVGQVGIDQTTPGTTDSVTVKSTAYQAQVSLTRPADVNAYLAGDVVGPTSAIITFPNIGPTAGHVLITGADLRIDAASVPSGMTTFELHLYDASPTAIADNAPFDLVAGDRAAYLGSITLDAPSDLGSTLFTQIDNVNKKVKLAAASTSLYGLLRTSGAYTPASAEVYTVRLNTVAV